MQVYMTGGGQRTGKMSQIAEKTLAIIEEQVTPYHNVADTSAAYFSDVEVKIFHFKVQYG
jgi:hypothetical protein